MKLKQMMDVFKHCVVPSYARAEIAFERGSGAWLWDLEGRKYLDCFSGIAVTGLGHCHPAVTRALKEQIDRLWHTSNLYYIGPQGELAQKLSDLSNKGKVFFCNSGGEANEAALKLARLWGKKFNPAKNVILSLEHSFHGRTLATVTATGQSKYKKGFEPLPSGFKHVNLNDIADLQRKADAKVCGFLVEFLQGEGGVTLPDKAFVSRIFSLAKKHKFLVIADEVQAGLCRTGKFFAYQHFNVVPDVITLAKSLANGFPIGAMIARQDVADLFSPGRHASTFGGNFLATAAANAVIDTMVGSRMDRQAQEKGEILGDGLRILKEKYAEFVSETKGLGLMRGLQLTDKIDGAEFVKKARAKGLIVGTAGQNVLRLLPPLVITPAEIKTALNILDEVFYEYLIQDKPLFKNITAEPRPEKKRKKRR